MLKNTINSYGWMARLLHWFVSIMILIMLAVGFIMVDMPPSDDKWFIYMMHKATGILLLLLVTFRLVWRVINISPSLPQDLSHLQKLASKIAHYFLYLSMFLMPISGILMSLFGDHNINIFNIFTIEAFEKNAQIASLFHETHIIMAFLLVGLIAAHIGAALYHHFIRKDDILVRMIKSTKT